MQGAQTESRFRGIGRYTLSLVKAIVRNKGGNEIILALNGLFLDTIEPIRAAFDNILPQENIRVWHAPGPVMECQTGNERYREIAERIRESFMAGLQPDVILVCSLFEGFGDNAITSIGILDKTIPVAVILYDLIPLISPDKNFKTNKIYKDYYDRKIMSLKKAQKLLAISDSARLEAIDALGYDRRKIINISGACDTSFRVLNLSDFEKKTTCSNFGITKSFVMYTGGADDRKNLQRLIQAYALLPLSLKKIHQLVLVGKMPKGSINDLLLAVKKNGLSNDEVIITGYIDDEDLLKLYNCCKLFIFPSLHEGFGIPPLEAMLCGAPVIGSNATSLPEVIGREDALFDPTSVSSILDKLTQALTDEAFRTSLIAHGVIHAKKFSWDESAKRVLNSLIEFETKEETLSVEGSSLCTEETSLFSKRNKKIILLKLDHLGDLVLAIPAITKIKSKYPYARIDFVCGSWNVPFAESLKIFNNIYAFDFYKKKSAESAVTNNRELNAFLKKLGDYDISIDLRRQGDTRFILTKIDSKLKVGYETFDLDVDKKLDIMIPSHQDVPFIITPLNRTSAAVQMLKIVDALPVDINDFISFPDLCDNKVLKSTSIAIFPNAGNDVKEWGRENYIALIKLLVQNEQIQAVNIYFSNIKEAKEFSLNSEGKVFINYGLDFRQLVDSVSTNIICIANNSFGAHIASYLGVTVVGIYAGHETVSEWAPVFGESYVINTNELCSPCHIAKQSDCKYKMACINNIRIGYVYEKVIKIIHAKGKKSKDGGDSKIKLSNPKKGSREIITQLVDSITTVSHEPLDKSFLSTIAKMISFNHPPRPEIKQLFVDISELINFDSKTGVQRVTRSILKELLDNEPDGYMVEPVYSKRGVHGYYYARRFTAKFNNQIITGDDDPIEYYPGDIFLGLDLHHHVVIYQRDYLEALRRDGVKVFFVVYDLLPVLIRNSFHPQLEIIHDMWLKTIFNFDGAVCISRAVAQELTEWYNERNLPRSRPFKISWFHLGADIDSSVPTYGLPDNFDAILKELTLRPTFLTVGTVEPRKGQAQILFAFELLWKKGININIVIVGKQGWMVEKLIKRLRNHEELNKRLFWFECASDEFLEKIYSAAKCLITASEGEGFGLPLIEAARHKVPIIARDIPVFREVAGDCALYFRGKNPEDLAKAIIEWLELAKKDSVPLSVNMPWQTWEQATQQLLGSIIPKSSTDNLETHFESLIIKNSNNKLKLVKNNKTYIQKLINTYTVLIILSRFREPLKKIYYGLRLNRLLR